MTKLEPLIKPTRIITWQCPQCLQLHPTQDAAMECIAQGFPVVVEVGDIVLLCASDQEPVHPYGWFDGDKKWIHHKELTDDTPNKCHYSFYYVVTHIDSDPDDGHRPRIHLCTKALEKQGGGYTYYDTATPEEDVHHYIAKKITNNLPDGLVEDSKDLLGTVRKDLI